MIRLPAEEAARAIGVDRLAKAVTGVSTDTRDLKPGDLFVALAGERYDGHAFVPAAFAAGASGAVVEMGRPIAGDPDWRPPSGDGRLYRVPDTLRALGALARAVRRRSNAVVIGVTGSVGKTGTKDLIRAMASSVGPVVATTANLNNEIGVPLTLLRLERSTRVAIVEMGMRGRGQIHALASLAEPDVGVITRLAPVHLETLRTIEEVARAKAELLDDLPADGVAVVRVGEELLEPWLSRLGDRVVRYRLIAGTDDDHGEADVSGTLLESAGGEQGLRLAWPGGECAIPAPFTARHKLENVVAAAAACFAARLPVGTCVAGLSAAPLTPGRGDVISLGRVVILDDTYNANPVSMRAALDWLMDVSIAEGRRPVAVLGEMLELGPEAPRYHHEVGAYAAQVGIETLWATGENARALIEGYCSAGGDTSRAFVFYPTMEGVPSGESDVTAGAPDLLSAHDGREAILVKASRGMHLERVVAALQAQLGANRTEA